MKGQTKVMGMVLAGGLARRMNYSDKGLIKYHDRPLISYAIDALIGAVDRIVINANRNQMFYRKFGHEIITDQTDSFDGPLAGIFAVLNHTDADMLLVVPCDSPLIKTEHLLKLLSVRSESNVEVAVAFDGLRMHPVFLAIKITPSLINNLKEFLDSGQRKIEDWLKQVNCVYADYSDIPEIFANVNTLSELSLLENNVKDETG